MRQNAITERIIKDARTRADAILALGNARADEQRVKSEESIKEEQEAAMDKAEDEGAELRASMLRMAELDQAKLMLAMKREVIDRAFARSADMMRDMPPKAARAYIEGLLLKTAAGDEEIIVAEADAALYDPVFISSINAKLSGAGGKGELRLSGERRDLNGGFVLRRGDIEVNCAFDTIIKQIKPDMELEVSRMLFL
jgi:V/A-type H+-transporting ATPase subunit E